MSCILSLESISKIVPNNGQSLCILDDISACINEGSIFTILGPSGSGKSTLLRLMNRLDDPSEGRILFEGVNTKEMNVQSLRRRVGMVFQAPVVFDSTVDENIQYGTKLAGLKADSVELLARVGLPDDFLNRNAASLSGGEQQRVSIARALATNPEVLLMDEPTSALDPTARTRIEDLTQQLNHEGLTIVFVTHDMEQAKRLGTRTMLLVAGRKIEEGTTSEFFAEAKTEIARLFIEGKLSE